LTIAANNASMIVGDLAPPLTATYSGLVNGDTPASLASPPVLVASASPISAGAYPIKVTAVAGPDYTIAPVPGTLTVISDVGKAVLIPDPLAPTQTLLSIGGTSGNDVIQIAPGPTDGDVTVTFNKVALGTFHPTSRIRIHGGGGTDTISVSQTVTVPVWMYGDTGTVQLQGGGGPTLLLGGSGKATLWGGNGRTIMIGGSGVDSLLAGKGDTILIGGTTAYDANDRALQSLLNTWNSSAAYATRVSQLAADPNYPLSAATVFNNNVVDALFGGAGMDIFFQSPGDNLQNKQAGETVITANQTAAILAKSSVRAS
jgi:hypothetical protein